MCTSSSAGVRKAGMIITGIGVPSGRVGIGRLRRPCSSLSITSKRGAPIAYVALSCASPKIDPTVNQQLCTRCNIVTADATCRSVQSVTPCRVVHCAVWVRGCIKTIENRKLAMSVLTHRQHPKLPGYFTVATFMLTFVLFGLLVLRNCATVLARW